MPGVDWHEPYPSKSRVFVRNHHSFAELTHDGQRIEALLSGTTPLLTQSFYRRLTITRWLSENGYLLLLQYIGLSVTTLVPFPTPLWFAAGTACAYLFMRGPTIIPGLWLGTFMAYSLSHSGLFRAALSASLYSVEAYLLFYLTHRIRQPSLIFYQWTAWFKFLLCVILIISVISSAFIWLCPMDYYHTLPLWYIFCYVSLANLNGILWVALPIVTLDYFFPDIGEIRKSTKIVIAAYVSLFSILFFFLCINPISTNLCYFLSAACTAEILFSFIWGWCGAMSILFYLSVLLSMACLAHAPLLSLMQNYLLSLWFTVFSALIGISGITLSIARQRIQAAHWINKKRDDPLFIE